jgi:Polyketide cyclase / dehydrase and lipid transport
MKSLTALLSTMIIIAVVPAVATGGPALSSNQLTRLDHGDVVLVDALPPGGDPEHSQGGTAIIVVRAAPETVWRILLDYDRHAGLYPRVVAARVLESGVGRALVRYTLGVGPFSFGFHVNNYPDAERRRLTWRLAIDQHNDLFRDSWGYWQVEADPRGTLLTYAMAARTVLPRFLTRTAERDGLRETLRAVRQRAQHGI